MKKLTVFLLLIPVLARTQPFAVFAVREDSSFRVAYHQLGLRLDSIAGDGSDTTRFRWIIFSKDPTRKKENGR